jgi:GT2 family glycosyltransferase
MIERQYLNRKALNMLDIIIVNYKSTPYLLDCLSSVFGSFNGLSVNVFVFDNDSNDNVDQINESFPKTFLTKNTKNIGFSKAVNNVLKRTTSKYAVILNPDTIVDQEFLKSIVSYMDANPGVGIAGPKIFDQGGTIQGSARLFPTFHTVFFGRSALLTKMFPKNRFTCANLLTSTCDGKTPMEVDWVSGSCMTVRREALDDVGLLDERFFLYWEDVDWCKRMWKRGWKVAYYPEASIEHYVGGSSEQNLIRAIFEFHKSAYRYFKKYFKSYRLILKPVVFLGLSFRFFVLLFLRLARRRIVKLMQYAKTTVVQNKRINSFPALAKWFTSPREREN